MMTSDMARDTAPGSAPNAASTATTPARPGRLLLLAGHAGTGKTTLAKRAVALLKARSGQDYLFLDKDTAYGAFSSHIMSLLTGNPDDRDSPTYLNHLRDKEYSGLLYIARENLLLGMNVMLVGPFTREIMAGKFFRPTELGMPEFTECRIAWIDLDSAEAKRRIELRKDARDAWKLAYWDEYLKRRVEPPTHPALMRLDNTRFDAGKFEALVKHLMA
jgi:predicted kinase